MKLLKYFYNHENKQIFGRNLISWAKLLLFYLIFYTFLFSFWLLMLLVFLETIRNDRPNWVRKDSILNMKPGLSFRPRIPHEIIDSTLFIFNINDTNTYKHWINDLNDFLKPYKETSKNLKKCLNSTLRTAHCPFLPNLDQKENPCKNEFGYDLGEPCFLIKINKIFYWIPSPYRSHDNLPEGTNLTNLNLDEGNGLIILECNGENDFDKENLGEIKYWPMQGFPVEKYPYKNQMNYLSPFVFIRFLNVTKDILLSIECKIYDKKLKINKKEKVGYLQFELLIQTEPKGADEKK